MNSQLNYPTSDETLWADFARTSDPRVRNVLVGRFERLAFSIANRYARRGAEFEDICQVALVALVKAVDRYDPATNYRFSSFATPTIQGEIRRYFRDNCRSIHVPRGLQELSPRVQTSSRRLASKLGRSATPAEIASDLKVTEEEVLEVLRMEEAVHTASLDAELERSDLEGLSMERCLGREDAGLRQSEDRVCVQQALNTLSEPLQAILRMRYFDHMTQRAVAERLGCTQIRISRLERNALDQLRSSFAAVN